VSRVLFLSLDFFFSVSRFFLGFHPLRLLLSIRLSRILSSALSLSSLFLTLSRILSLVSSSTHLSFSSRILGLSPLSPHFLCFWPNLLAHHCHFHLHLFLAHFYSLFSASLDRSSKYLSSPSTHLIAFFEPRVGAALYLSLQSKNTLRPRSIYTNLES
jgi:hypothetical protein